MTTKHSDIHSRKIKKGHSPKNDTLITTTKKQELAQSSKNSKEKPPKSVGLFDEQIKKQKKKKTKSRVRKFVSLSIVAYLTYNSLYACGSPFDQNTEKPAICSAIDPIKLDLYSIYQSNYYKTNVDPYVNPVVNKSIQFYHEYGVPAQTQLNDFYWKQAKPALDRAYLITALNYYKHIHPVYKYKVAPVIQPYVDKVKPHLHHAKSYIDQVHPYYQNQIVPLYHQATEKALETQALIQHKYENLPPSVKQVEIDMRNKIMSLVNHLEEIEMGPILLDLYWSIIDFYQTHFLPVFHSTHTVKQIKLLYDENAKAYIDQNVKPVIAQVNHKVHLDAFFQHILSLLPQREIIPEEPVYTAKSAYTQVKTSSAVPKTQTVPITSPAASVKTVTVSKSSSSTTDDAVPASTTVAPSTTGISKKVQAQATIAKSVTKNNDDHIVKVESSVRPKSTVSYVPDPKAAPDANKKEAIYCPTCNAAEEQLIVANTEKEIAPVRTDKHVIAVPTDHELFEVHEEHLDLPSQPSSPNKDFEGSEQIVIQAPIPKKETVKEEVYSIQTEVPVESAKKETPTVKEEDIVFSIQTEVPTATDEEEPIFSIQTEASIESNIEDKLEEEHNEDVDQKIVEEIRHEAKKDEFKKEDQIFVPPAIEKEELVLESRGEKPIGDEPVFVKVEEPQVEETVHFEEPIVKVEEPVQCEEPIDVVPVEKSDEKINEQPTVQVDEQKPEQHQEAKERPIFNNNEPLAKRQIEVPVEM